MSIGQRVRYIGPKKDRHGIEIPYTFGTVTDDAEIGVTVKLDENDYAQTWRGSVGAFGRSWSPIRYVAKVELYEQIERGQSVGNGYAVARFLPDNTRLHRIHDFGSDDGAARSLVEKLNADPSFQIYLPIGYPGPDGPQKHLRARDFPREEFLSIGYTEAESWTLYYSQRARAVSDPLSPYGQIIMAKLVTREGYPAEPLTPREQAWLEERTALRAHPVLRMRMDVEESGKYGSWSKEETQARLAASALGEIALRAAGIIQ